ncbi:MAG: two-component sensor histidine kinase [Planctomycetaceae bacterium]|jgi:signal transduction histidine kinase|nr:two-component sensor histidine kinase [Planctomycetaceae bacterium]
MDEQYTEITRLAGGLAHEIKNPLSTIRLNIELLSEDLEQIDSPQSRRAQQRIKVVQNECRRLESLLDDFLRFTKADNPELLPGNVNNEIQDIIEFFRLKAKESEIEVIAYLASDLPSVLIDRGLFHQAMINLLLNALQAMPNGGQLMISTRAGGNEIVIDLIDTGMGMDEKTLANLYNAFYSTKKGGSGLGLATTQKIIKAHGGTISVQSELNCGTKFTITIPSLPRLAEK